MVQFTIMTKRALTRKALFIHCIGPLNKEEIGIRIRLEGPPSSIRLLFLWFFSDAAGLTVINMVATIAWCEEQPKPFDLRSLADHWTTDQPKHFTTLNQSSLLCFLLNIFFFKMNCKNSQNLELTHSNHCFYNYCINISQRIHKTFIWPTSNAS